MIPYDDLVIALQAWRAKQGLPVAQLSGQFAAPPPAPAAAPAFAEVRSTPPLPFAAAVSEPPPLEVPSDDSLDVDNSLIEEHYEADGADFAMGFAGAADGATAVGPEDEVGGTEVAPPTGQPRGRNEDW